MHSWNTCFVRYELSEQYSRSVFTAPTVAVTHSYSSDWTALYCALEHSLYAQFTKPFLFLRRWVWLARLFLAQLDSSKLQTRSDLHTPYGVWLSTSEFLMWWFSSPTHILGKDPLHGHYHKLPCTHIAQFGNWYHSVHHDLWLGKSVPWLCDVFVVCRASRGATLA